MSGRVTHPRLHSTSAFNGGRAILPRFMAEKAGKRNRSPSFKRTPPANGFAAGAQSIAIRFPPSPSPRSRNAGIASSRSAWTHLNPVPPAHRDKAAMSRAQSLLAQSGPLRLLTGPPAMESSPDFSERDDTSDSAKQIGEAGFQTFCNLFDVHERNIAHAALDTAVVCSV